MIWVPQLRNHPEFREGARGMVPQIPGLAAWGLMTGVAMANSGLSLFEAFAMALLVYAGSSQLAALPLLVAGAPAWVILATGFCVNLRFVVFSLHLRELMIRQPLVHRLVSGYLCTDMGYVLLVSRYPDLTGDDDARLAREAFLAGTSAVNWASWMFPSLAGIVLANFIPPQWGLGFAGILCLVGILCSLATTRLRVLAMAVAGAAGVVAYSLPLKLNIVLAIAVAVAVCMVAESRTRPLRVQP